MSELRHRLEAEIAACLPETVALRQTLHRFPEVHFEEYETSRRLQEILCAFNIPHTTGHAGGTGIVATLGGKLPGPTVALRADMDALPIQEATGLPYASQHAGRMHACGHDGHMACLMGAARILKHHEKELPGTVKIIFQPAEEELAGGRRIVEEGHLEGVAAVFALHGWPELPVGTVASRPGPFLASADFFRITIEGRGGHAANPGANTDPVVIAAQIVTHLQTLVSRHVNPWDAAVVTVASIHGGDAPNITPDTVVLEGTWRALTSGTRQQLHAGIRQVAEGVSRASGATATVETIGAGYPPLINDVEMARFVAETANQHLGSTAFQECPHPLMVAEDFAFYLEATPGAFLLLGVAGAEGGAAPGLHTDTFDFNDEAIPYGIQMLVTLATDFLANDQSAGGASTA